VVAVDLETTGLSARDDRVVELALVSADRTVTTLVRPEPPRRLSGPHGLSTGHLAAAPRFADVADTVRDALEGRLVVGHNAAFDVAFLEAEFARTGQPIGPIPFICTIALAAMLDLGHERRRLAYACERYGVELRRPHAALDDARAAADLFALYAAMCAQRGLDLVSLHASHPCEPCARSWELPEAPLRR